MQKRLSTILTAAMNILRIRENLFMIYMYYITMQYLKSYTICSNIVLSFTNPSALNINTIGTSVRIYGSVVRI
jgi:hypothetical protein